MRATLAQETTERARLLSVQPETRYAKSGDLHIAYRVEGDGTFDVVEIPPGLWSMEFDAFRPEGRDWVRKLTSFARVISFDKRGTGLSDRVQGAPSLEERMDDVRAVMDAVGSQCLGLQVRVGLAYLGR